MSRAITISVPPLSANSLAARLGVSKSRRDRIFAIVAKAARKRASAGLNGRRKAAKRHAVKARFSTTHSGKHSNGKGARNAR